MLKLSWEECSPARTHIANHESTYDVEQMDIAQAVKMLEDLNEEIGPDHEAFGRVTNENDKFFGWIQIAWSSAGSRRHTYTKAGCQPLVVHTDYI